jgi:hypothetical protein
MSNTIVKIVKLGKGAFCFNSLANAPRLISAGKCSTQVEIVEILSEFHPFYGGLEVQFSPFSQFLTNKVKILKKSIINFIN